MIDKPAQKDDLKGRLSRYREITITVIGRKSGRSISIPIWFVFEDPTLYLLPVQGSDTQWYKNSRTRKFGSMCAAQRLNFAPPLLLTPNRSRL